MATQWQSNGDTILTIFFGTISLFLLIVKAGLAGKVVGLYERVIKVDSARYYLHIQFEVDVEPLLMIWCCRWRKRSVIFAWISVWMDVRPICCVECIFTGQRLDVPVWVFSCDRRTLERLQCSDCIQIYQVWSRKNVFWIWMRRIYMALYTSVSSTPTKILKVVIRHKQLILPLHNRNCEIKIAQVHKPPISL